MQIQPLEHGKYYHIYNRGVNSCDIFRDEDDYLRFLKLYDKYIEPIADTFEWALMGNHFHLLVFIKEEVDIKTQYELNQVTASETPSVVANPDGGEGCNSIKESNLKSNLANSEGSEDCEGWKTRKPLPANQLSHLFNAYAQYFNKKYERHGTLFERPFKRKRIDNDTYLQQLVIYIHNNPVHHGFCQYLWTSFQNCMSQTTSTLKRNDVLKWFNNIENFQLMHAQQIDIMSLDTWLSIN